MSLNLFNLFKLYQTVRKSIEFDVTRKDFKLGKFSSSKIFKIKKSRKQDDREEVHNSACDV